MYFLPYPCNGSMQESRTREFPLLEDVNTRRSLVRVLSVAGQEQTWPLALPLPAQVTCVPRHSPRWELRAALWHLHASVGCSQATGRAEWLSWQLLWLILRISALRAFQRNLNDSKSDTVRALLMSSLLPLSCKWILRASHWYPRLPVVLCSLWSSRPRVVEFKAEGQVHSNQVRSPQDGRLPWAFF